MATTNITTAGIKKFLKSYTSEQAISEYISNGFDAGATTVALDFSLGAFNSIVELHITDNGSGIDIDNLEKSFLPFYESDKARKISSPVHTSLMKGKNGVGRLTFFKFANMVSWDTTYNKENELRSGTIQIDQSNLKDYVPSCYIEAVSKTTGTRVTFSDTQLYLEEFDKIIIPYLVAEFCWFLELNKSRNFQILINGVKLSYESNIVDHEESIGIIHEKSNTIFNCRFIQWKFPLHKELSKYYFLNSNGIEIYKDYTTLNKKGDEFYHSVYIQSEFFDDFYSGREDPGQTILFGKAKSSLEYKFLISKINALLRQKRKPYLRTFATKLVEKYESDGVLPVYENEWEEKYKKPQLEQTLIGLYEAEPKLFTNLNISQKRTFVRFLDLLLDSNEREHLLKIIDEIVELEPEERADLAKLFQANRLDRIIETIKLIEDRYTLYYKLRDIVFEPSLKANEVDHLQKLIESHYWIFGEQFHLVTAAEPKFEEALRRYIFHLTEKDEVVNIEHPHKLKEMDIFACRQNLLVDRIDNIVVELKHPAISLGAEQYLQVDKYLQVILSRPEFNASNMHWEFYLVGNKFDTSGYIERQISTNKNHGVPGLVQSLHDGRVKVIVRTWSEIFATFEIRHNHLNAKLQLEREQLVNDLGSAPEVIVSIANNTAAEPEQVNIPVATPV